MSHRNTLKKKKNISSSLKLLKISIFPNHITKSCQNNQIQFTIHISTFKDPSTILSLIKTSQKKKRKKEIPCPIETLKKKERTAFLKLLKISIFPNHITKITKFNYTIHTSTFKDPSAILYLSNLVKKKKKEKILPP